MVWKKKTNSLRKITSHKTETSLNIVNFEIVEKNLKNVKKLWKLCVGKFTVDELICVDTIR